MKKFFKLQSLPLIVILLLAAFVRLYKITDYMTFLGDEGRDVLIVYNILHGHFTLLGPTSSVGGFFLGPIYYYFMAPFLWIFRYHPAGPAIMVALFGVATVWLVFKIGEEFFNKTSALIAAALYSLSPVVIAYSRSSWNPNIVPFFTVITLYLLYLYFKKNQKKYLIFSGVSFAILIQLHYLATFVAATMLMYVFFANVVLLKTDNKSLDEKELRIMNHELRILKNKKLYLLLLNSYFLILTGFLIGFSPFLLFEARHGFPNIRSIIKFIFTSSDVHASVNFFGTIANVFFRLFARLVTAFPPPEQVSLNAHPDIAIRYWLTVLLGLCSIGYFIWNIRKNFYQKFLQYSLIFIWFFAGILLFGLYRKQIYDYYFGFLFPVPFWLSAYFISYLFSRKILMPIGIIATIALIWINLLGLPFRFAPNRQYEQVKMISEFVKNKAQGKPYNFALITGSNSDYAYRYFFTIWGVPPVTIQNPAVDPKRTSVTDQLLIVCETLPCSPLGNPSWEVAGFGRAEIANKWNVSVVEVYKLVHYKGK